VLRICLISIAVFVFALAGTVSAESPFNVDFFCGWGDCYRPMDWTPVEIGVSSTLAKPLGCAIEISAAQDGLNTLNIRHRFVLTPDVPENLPLVTKFAFAADGCNIRLIEIADGKRERTVYEEKRDFWGGSFGDRRLKAISENDMLIGHIGVRRFGRENSQESIHQAVSIALPLRFGNTSSSSMWMDQGNLFEYEQLPGGPNKA